MSHHRLSTPASQAGRRWKVGPVYRASDLFIDVSGTVIEPSVCEHLDSDDECADTR
jgi:hypothetical protein